MRVQHNYNLSGLDTDAVSFYKPDMSPFTQEEQDSLIDEINSLLPDMIRYAHDGYYDSVVVLKAKNYVTQQGSKIKMKGSSIVDAKKEPALREFIKEVVNDLLATSGENVPSIYKKYAKEAYDIQDISRWATKKSITKAVLTSERANETKVKDALGNDAFQEGDKVYLYSAIDGMKQDSRKGELVFLKNGSPKMVENHILKKIDRWSGDHDKLHYVERVYQTLKIFENVVDMNRTIKYHLKSNIKLLEDL